MSRGHKLKKFISAVAAALLPIAALSSITAAPAQAVVTPGPALTCTSGGFYTDATKNIFQFNSSTDSFDWAFSSRHALTTALDGLAFDSRDNYLYGWNAGHLYQVDNTGAEVDLGVQGGLSATLESADYWPSADVIISATNGSWRSTKVASDSTSATTSAAITASGGNLAEDHVLVPTSSTVAEVYGLDSGKVYDTTVTLTAGVLTSASTRSVSVTLPSAVTSSGNTAASAQAPAAYSDAAGNVYFIMTKASQAKHDIISYTSAQLAAMFASPPVTATPTYYLNIASSNAAYGTSPSDGAGCKTAPSMFSPALVTTTAATVSGTSATLGGTVTPGNFSGATIPVGNAVICYSSSNAVDANGILSSSPTCSSGNTVAVAQNAANTAIPDYNLSGLAAGTYYYQAKATNSSALTNHGAVLSFTIAGTPSGFNVTWDPNGGSVSPTSSSNVTTVTAPTPTLAGNAFNGWTCVPDGTPVSPVSAGTTFTPSANTTCTASWTAYTVTYSYGTGGGTVPTSPNSGVVVLPVQGAMTAPTGGYTFGGWTCTPGTPTTTLAAGASFTPSGNATCTAVWNASASGYNVTWDPNGGSVTPTTSSNVTTVTAPTPTKAGNAFNGWDCTPAGTPANPVAAAATFTPSAATTCVASWTAYTVTYSYGTGGGTVPTSPNSGVVVLPVQGAMTAPTGGYTFGGWTCTPGTPTTTLAAGASFTPSGNATCTAVWNAPTPTTYNVTWNYNNGSGNTTSSGVTTVTTPNPSNPGYSFNGWSCSPAGTPANLVAAGVTFTPSANTTCTASWTYIPPVYTVTFVSNGSTVSSTSGVAGTVITCPAAPTRAGWIFKGWSACAAGGSYTITGSATISAIWVEELAAQPNANGGENNHQAAPAILVVNPAINGDVYSDPTSGMRLTLTPHEADQTPAPLNSENQVVFKDGRLAKVAGSGLQPNSDVKVYISKDAITGLQSLTVGTAAIRNKSAIIGDVVLLGTLHTDATGSFSEFLPIPQGLAIGAHVLQVDGYAKDWSLQSANFPVLYALPKVVTKSLTVYFTPDSAEFTAATKAAIAALVAELPKDGEQFSISSKGFVYPIDSHTANMQISSARAKAVAGAIKAAIKDLGQEATVDHVGLGRLKAAKSTSRRVQATVSWTVYTTTA